MPLKVLEYKGFAFEIFLLLVESMRGNRDT